MSDKVYILGGLRSYIGVENGMYKHLPAEKLGAEVLKKVMDKYNISKPDYIIGGNGVGAGGNITRLMMLEAGVSCEVPAYTVDMQCGSALETMAIDAAKIKSGQADIIIAGGFESSSTAPGRRYNKNHPDYEKMGGKIAGIMWLNLFLKLMMSLLCYMGQKRQLLSKIYQEKK